VYVTSLATEVGYEVEKEVLRIPSTRNIAIVGRRHQQDEGEGDDEKRRRETVKEILEREVGSVEDVGREWVERVRKIAKGKGAGH
jgi:tRNASer (uridine44-2'-O)-methyltransferase